MRWQRATLILTALLIGAGVLGFYWKVIQATQHPPAPETAAQSSTARHLTAPEITFVDPSLGPKDARVTVVEFGDYLCPFCRDSSDAIDQLLKQHARDVRFVWKNDPSPLHAGADQASEAAMCAAQQNAFWPYHRHLMTGQQSTYDQAALTLAAGDLGLDTGAFGTCLASHGAKPLVDRTLDEARALGITALPTFFINDTRYEGQMTYAQLEQALTTSP